MNIKPPKYLAVAAMRNGEIKMLGGADKRRDAHLIVAKDRERRHPAHSPVARYLIWRGTYELASDMAVINQNQNQENPHA